MSNQQNSPPEIVAIYGLIKRVVPALEKQIKLEIIPTHEGKDIFEIDYENSYIVLRGNNAISLSSALNWYLKYYLDVHLSWCGDQLNLPNELPLPTKLLRKVIDQKYRVYQNYCTINYTASWWTWDRWEREIDFMALNGINMPLSVVGVDAVWYNSLLKFNFTDEEARSFLVGPAFFAWQWMTNIQSHGGPLPKSWIEKSIILGKKIMERQLEYGMFPIQQGFSGYVPISLIQKYPSVSISKEESWCNFPSTAQLDPLEPLFTEFGKVFLEEQEKLFGAHHFYAADPFHEGSPPQEGSEYLNKVGQTISNLITDFDPDATWIIQAWSIRKDIISVVPKSALLILDLSGEKYASTENFWGYNFVAGNLHNFGGRTNLHGDLRLIASNQYKSINQSASNVVGAGLFMESLMQNPVYYDLAFEVNISQESIAIESWLKNYAKRRYGAFSENANNAWSILLNTAYQTGTNGVENSSIICARPALDVKKSGPNNGFSVPYSNNDLLLALNLLLIDSEFLKSSDAYKYDIVDILRQILSNLGQIMSKEISVAFKEKNTFIFNNASTSFLILLKDVNTLLSTRTEFSLEKWIKDARALGTSQYESDLYEYNATLLVTIWGPEEYPEIFDYSWREWSGLIDQYYSMRWRKFFDMLLVHLENGTDYLEEDLPKVYGREAFRANAFYTQLANDEISWIKSRKTFTPTVSINELQIVKELIGKYKNIIL